MTRYLLPLLTLAIMSCQSEKKTQVERTELKVKPYPQTKKGDVSDNYFGTIVPDPYRWLEYDTAADVADWVKDQNEVTNDYLNQIPFRKKIEDRLTELWNYPRFSAPFKEGEYYFFYKNDGLQNQAVLYYQKGLEGSPEVFIDANKLSEDGTVSLAGVWFSKDHQKAAYSIARSGSDWNEIYVMDVKTREKSNDVLNWVKFSGASWQGDGFYYSRYDEPAKGKEFSNLNQNHKIYYHKLGDPQSKDKLVYDDKAHPLRYNSAQVSEDEKYLFIYTTEGTQGTELYWSDLTKANSGIKLLFKGFKYNYSVIDNKENKFLVLTDNGAPKYRLIEVDPANMAESNWKDIVPQKEELLENVGTGGGKIFAAYLKDASTRIYQHDMEGKMEHEIQLPGIGTAMGFGSEREDMEFFYTFTSYTYPPTIFRYDIASGKSTQFRKSEAKFNPEDFETRQVFYPGKDGTKVPMFLVHKKGLKMDGNNPVYLYGYGGFNISLTPSFSIARVAMLEHGVIYAIANLRGGGEYGEDWHKAGMFEKKQNVFDDFIAAAEYLIKEKYTNSSKLAIAGGSNGGLLVGAVMTQRPELFKVALPAVGVMDMLRYHKFTAGFGWKVEYGSSEDAKSFPYLYKYSPLHNLKEGVNYPATLVTTADHDDRVVPAHSFKYAATLQERHSGPNPVLIRIDTKAGHGAGKPTSKQIEEAADIYSFVLWNLNVDVK